MAELEQQMINFEEKIDEVVTEDLPKINKGLEKDGLEIIKLTDKESFMAKD